MSQSDDFDYGTTIHLPQTDFPRRAGLAQLEPKILSRWNKMGFYQQQRETSKGREKFILHFGPPFANGHIHLGHLLSHTLKDFVCRSQQMLGRDAPLIPGYDCHGLPIEWKIEEKYRAEKKNTTKDSDPVSFRRECRDYAAHWSTVQTGELQRLGINGDWQNPYSTMHNKSEAKIASEIHKFLLNGSLYRGSKPVMWSTVEQTALAEAEVEYKDVMSDTVYVKFPIKSGGPEELRSASIVIWTTTPWTLPGNRAVAYGEDIEYVAIEITAIADEATARTGDKIVIAKALLESLQKVSGITAYKNFWSGTGRDLTGTVCHHCLAGKGYNFDVPVLPGDFVTTETGTGFVHVAPGHGEDDYHLGLAHKIEIPHTVQGDGTYFPDVPLFAGMMVYDSEKKYWPANKEVIKTLIETGALVAKNKISHSYPHSWRSKAPVIFRNTPQWFISMEKNDLRKKALSEIEKTRFVPAKGKNRIGSMVESRGDWCVSRQRAWGVPIAIFVDKKTGQPLRDEKVLRNIISVFEKEGSDAWYKHSASHFLGSDYNAGDYEQVMDIIDVWFESGSTHAFVLEDREKWPAVQWPADLYLEGSDQHRGWFQSSLLEAVGTRGRAPYKAVLTHGFILDEKGYKMSKSVGNVTAPDKLMDNYGADILRLWVAGSDYTEDIKFGENILKGHVDVYRRIRNTFCYLLGSIDDGARVSYGELGDFDKWVLHRLSALDATVRQSIADFDFLKIINELNNFCARDLSAFYFDVCKDTLYCEAKSSIKRRAIVTVLDEVFKYLCHWLSPVLVYTCEEAWLSYKGLSLESDSHESIHLSQMPSPPAEWKNDALAQTWEKIAAVRSVVTGALEIKRAEKAIGASLEASPRVYVADTALASVLQSIDFADVCITSAITIETGASPSGSFTLQGVEGISVVFEKASGQKCARCWKYTPDVGSDKAHPSVCARCAGVVKLALKERAA